MMKIAGLGIFVAGMIMMVTSAQALDWDSRIDAGVEYHFVSGDTDNAPGIYASYEIDLPEPISIVVGTSYFTSDYKFKQFSGSYDSIGLELLLRLRWDMDQWRPYVSAGGAQFFNSFDNVDMSDKLSLIAEGGTFLQLTDNVKINMCLRYMTLQPHNVDPAIGDIDMDAFVLRCGVVFDL